MSSTRVAKRITKILFLLIIVYTASYGILFSLRFALGTEFPVVVVEGKSMTPTYYDGDLLIVQGVIDKSKIDPQKDIIVFHSPYNWDLLIVHRVIDCLTINSQLHFKTRGDNNLYPDPWYVPERNVIGIVVGKIPAFGLVVTITQSTIGIVFIVSLIVIVIAIDIFYSKD